MVDAVISYPGSKRRFYEYMVDYFPTDMKVFIEPFFGGGSVSLAIADDPRFTKLERMVGGDLYTEMWAFWSGIKQNPDAVVEIATQWFKGSCPHQQELYSIGFSADKARLYLEGGDKADFEKDNNITDNEKQYIRDALKLYEVAINEAKAFWDWTQQVDTTQLSLEQRAARMLLVNRISFSGMGDSGSLSKDQFCDFRLEKLNAVYPVSKLLQKIELYNVSFEETMKISNERPDDTFIFLDPPYYNQEGSGLYGKGGSTHKGFPHQHFAEYTKNEVKCKWFVTYDDSVAVRKLFTGGTAVGDRCYFKPFTIPGGYTLAGKTAENALAGEELFIANYDINNLNMNDDFDF